jgi:hypothetical protein
VFVIEDPGVFFYDCLPSAKEGRNDMQLHDAIDKGRDHPMNAVRTSAMLGELLVRSISLAAGVSLIILLLAAMFSSPVT